MGTAVPLRPFPGEYLCVDHRAFDAGRNTQGGVPDIARFFPEDGPQEFFFRGELRFSLGGDLPDQDVARLHRHTHADDAAVVEVSQGLFPQIGDIPGDLFLAELRIPGHRLEFLDMDRGVDVVLDDPFADQDGILVVVPPPGHEGDHHVPSQGQFPLVRGGAVCNDLSLAHLLPFADNGLLVETGVLVGALILDQVVDIHPRVQPFLRGGVAFDDDARGIHTLHHTRSPGRHNRTGVPRHNGFHPRAHQGYLGFHQGHRLPLHVGSHQSPVGVVMFQKRDQGRRHTDQLIGRNIHHVDIRRHDGEKIASLSRGNQRPDELSILVEGSVSLGDDLVLLFDGRQITDIIEHPPLFHHTVRRFNESECIHPGEGAQGDDQTDVRTFRGFHRTDAAVMGGMNVADLESRPFSRQTSRPEGRQSSFVRNLGKRVGLIHELRKLAASEKFVHDGRDRLGVDEIVGHHGFDVLQAHLLLDRALHPDQADPVLVFDQFPHGTDPAVAQMVDVVHTAIGGAVFKVDQILDGRQDILIAQNRHTRRNIQPELVIHLRTPHIGEIIAIRFKKEAVEEFVRGLRRWRIARSESPVDLDDRVLRRLDPVHQERIPNGGILAIFIDMNEPEGGNPLVPKKLQPFRRQLLVTPDQDFAGLGIEYIGREDSADDILVVHRYPGHCGIDHLLQQGFGDLPPLLDNDLSCLRLDISGGLFPDQRIIHLHVEATVLQKNLFDVVEVIQDELRGISHRLQEDRHRHLSPAVNSHIEKVLGIEFEIQPRPADRNDPG